jgi:hypothetical protein
VADQVPADVGVVRRQGLDLGERFLDPVLAEVALTGRDRGPELAPLLAAMGKDRAVRRLEAAARR